MTTYRCQQCGAPATVANGAVLRTCACANSVVVASIKAHATGKSKTQG